MIKLGITQTLEAVRKSDFGMYLSSLDGSKEEQVLLPKNQVPDALSPGDSIEVFIYKDSEDRLIATTTTPALELGQLACLKVVEVNSIGAFLDWGLAKDLLLPFKEQTKRVATNDEVLVSLYVDKSNRLCATMNVYEFLETASPYQKDDRVRGTVYESSDEFGIFVAVDNRYSALIPRIEVFHDLKAGDCIEARVTSVREDGKLNLSLREKTFIQMDADSELIYQKLLEQNGFLPFHDKSDPEIIKREFGLSKNAFKRAIGRLLKEKKIVLEPKGIKQI